MQAQDAEEVSTVKEEFGEMTLSESREAQSPVCTKNNVNLGTFQTIQDGDYKLSEVNYEADIEKMIPESPLSSDSETIGKDLPSPEVLPSPKETLKLKEQQGLIQNESIRNWLQKISQMQTEIQQKLNIEQTNNLNNHSHNAHQFGEFPVTKQQQNAPSNTPRVVKYQDLPYMGEMTLDNSKPRRGRKPKKADICHLIYKNYGTIFPGTPNPKSLLEKDSNCQRRNGGDKDEANNRSDVQNRIISSLLEKRLTQTQETNKLSLKSANKVSKNNNKVVEVHHQQNHQNEPLNLCVRDLNQLKIRLLKKSDDIYLPEVKSEPNSDSDEVEIVGETPPPPLLTQVSSASACSTPSETLNFCSNSVDGRKTPISSGNGNEGSGGPGGYVYWPNAGVFIHPLALQQQLMYYQKMAQNNNYTLPQRNLPLPLLPASLNIPDKPVSPNSSSSNLEQTRKLVPKKSLSSSTSSSKKASEDEEVQNSSSIKPKRSLAEKGDKTPIKRKRSAIFIPPIPAENQTNPATEVSICKFKFTGGAKPSLQEKKMLSVDSGGNFRYYSGTGDKSMRGYEFFPRETLQQQVGNAQGSSTGAFLQASGEKIHPNSLVDFTGKQAHAEFMLTPDLPQNIPHRLQQPELTTNHRHKKRKSRKSLQREKLEQTFKEKGFLIQTQQLESAEGATYCKFRQLRKFTRYLFRSWKDYLPGSVTEPPGGGGGGGEGEAEGETAEHSDNEPESEHESESYTTTSSSRIGLGMGIPFTNTSDEQTTV